MTKRVLVVDDDPAMVGTLCDILELHGWETLKGFDGAAASRLVDEHEVDVVLMDVRMPGVGGVDALRTIKARHPRTDVMLMTAYAAQDLLDQAARDGAFRILRKPVQVPELLDLLRLAARASRALLVVDDDRQYLASLCDTLGLEGIETLRATTLDDALRCLRAEAPRAVLLDLKLDDLDPAATVQAVRGADPAALLMLYSGHDEELARTLEEMPLGVVDAAFTKPLPIRLLVERLNDHAGR